MIAWVHLWMLAGLTAVAVPVVVHLLRNRRFELADLGTIRFLRQAVHETTRWRRLRELFLLVLRLLAVILLAALFARPYLAGNAAQHDRDAEAVVLLDASGSMSGRLLGRAVWDAVREIGRDVLARLPESAATCVAVFADQAVPAPTLPDRPAVGAGTDYARALRWAADRLRASGARRKEVTLVTDLQRSGLPQQPLADWPADLAVRLRVVPPPGTHNLAVASVTCLTPYPADEARFAVRLSASGTLPKGTADVSFQVDGRPAEERALPSESQEAVFSLRPPPAGLCRGTVRVAAADAWPDDDRLNFAFVLRRPLRLVVVDGTPAAASQESGSYFLTTALAGARDGDGRAAYTLDVRSDVSGLSGADAVWLCDPPALAAPQAKELAETVKRGVGLVVFLGDHADESALRILQQANLLPAWVGPNRIPVPEPIGEWDSAHPVMRAFASAETGNLRRIVFRDAFQVKPDTDSVVLARLAGGRPAIVAGRLEQGRTVLVANPCSRAWTDWPAERIFLPLMREIAAYVSGLGDRRDELVSRPASVTVTEPPGVYGDGSLRVVLPDPRESQIEPCTEAEFRAALGIGPAPEDETVADQDVLPAGRERRREWWRWLALALAGVLLLECLTSDWPRRRPAAA